MKYVLMPTEPTDEIGSAGYEACNDEYISNGPPGYSDKVYIAALTARPAIDAAEVEAVAKTICCPLGCVNGPFGTECASYNCRDAARAVLLRYGRIAEKDTKDDGVR